ncbi:MAG: hypothetical protein IJ605_01680 [Prevotella sp.]|nr:hypothetical protein [Prevotella sp.]
MEKKTIYRKPEIRLRTTDMDCLLEGGSVTNIIDGGGGGGNSAESPRRRAFIS